MKKFFHNLYRSIFPDDAEKTEEPETPDVDESSIIPDLHLFLVQLARWISDHLEYENRVGRELPSDSKLIFRFRLDDYVTELVEFFSRKKLLEMQKDSLFRAGIEVLLPPEHIREVLPWRIRRQLFTRLLQKIATHTGMPYPVVTRKFYDHLVERDVINGISNQQAIESYQEAIADLSRENETVEPAEPVAPDGTPPETEAVDTAEVLTKALFACGATNYTHLTRILSRRHILDFVWLVFLYTLIAAVAVVLAEAITGFLNERLPVSLDAMTWQIVVIVIYLMQITIRVHRFRYRSYRRKTLIRVSNAIALTLGISYKEMDDVLHNIYGTNLHHLRSALLPRARR
ncbi:MAG: hypothetical protein PF508_15290 [Spirochaeta sp.]|jgi:hypothetical protein|nr:hypothetical protein [Spirochaeta sp.]